MNNYAALAQILKERILEADSEFDVRLIAKARELAGDRVRTIRGAASYVFAAYPDIVRQVTSAYERRRRAELRAKKADEAKKAETKKTDETKNG